MGRKSNGKPPSSLAKRLNEIAKRDRLTNEEIGQALGQHRITVSRWRGRGRLPKNFHVRAALEKFVEAREKATR